MIRIGIYYLLVVAVMYGIQYRLLYYPARQTTREVIDEAAASGLELWPGEPADYRGFISKHQKTPVKGTILIFHGNAGTAADRIYYIEPLQRLGYRPVLIEYPAYGARSGSVGEPSMVADAIEVVRMSEEEFGAPIYLWGESLGSAIAAAAAADNHPAVKGVVMLTPWERLPDLAQRKFWFLPVKWLVKDTYDNIDNLNKFTGPVAVIMAGRDELIPNHHTRRLYEALHNPKKLWTFPDAGHNTWPTAPHLPWWEEVMNFVRNTE
ncbi:MAG: alpha/beta hydrolase [Sedimentisphaerales bacterium]|nr:alpha/beta hydrolase [Sedimentisphaerales bacterium]